MKLFSNLIFLFLFLKLFTLSDSQETFAFYYTAMEMPQNIYLSRIKILNLRHSFKSDNTILLLSVDSNTSYIQYITYIIQITFTKSAQLMRW